MGRRNGKKADIISILREMGLPEKEAGALQRRAEERRVPIDAVIVMALTDAASAMGRA